MTPLKTAVGKEDEDYEQSRKSDQTESIHKADDGRDAGGHAGATGVKLYNPKQSGRSGRFFLGFLCH